MAHYHGKQRTGVKLQINEGDVYQNASIFLGEEFVRITETKGGETINAYFDRDQLKSIKTISKND